MIIGILKQIGINGIWKYHFNRQLKIYIHNDSLKSDMEKIKSKLSRIASVRIRGAIVCSRTRWYRNGERNSKYFYDLWKNESKKRKHITSLVVIDGDKITNPKDIRSRGRRAFFSGRYTPQEIRIPAVRSLKKILKRRMLYPKGTRKFVKALCLLTNVSAH